MNRDMREQYRFFLKDTVRKKIDFLQTDQSQGIAPPPAQKPVPPDAAVIPLPSPLSCPSITDISLAMAIKNRQSRRNFADIPVTLEELSFLLWSTQGVRKQLSLASVLRTVPSAGARHSFETYLIVRNVTGIDPGVYRYLPLRHGLLFELAHEHLISKTVDAVFGQSFVAEAAVTFVWTTIPYRMEWRYDLAAHKVIALDAGHVCQNLYLACEAIECGTCAIAAYDQEGIDALLHLDGKDEFTIYLAPVGRKK